MNKFAVPQNFGHPLRTPLLREHFVYRAYDAQGDLLYVGCSARIEDRIKAHKHGSDWWPFMATMRIAGPYNYETARDLEREAIHTERAMYNFTPIHRSLARMHTRVYNRHNARLAAEGLSWREAHDVALAHAALVTGWQGNRNPLRITDLTLPAAQRREHEDIRAHSERAA